MMLYYIIIILHSMFINIITVYLEVYCLFTVTFHSHVPVSLLSPYNIQNVQYGFTAYAVFKGCIPAGDKVYCTLV